MARDKISEDEIKSVLAVRELVFEKEIGQGMFGSVVAATRLLKGQPGKRPLRRYAIKLMKDESDPEKKSQQLKYQERELGLLSEGKLWHENIIRYYDSWQHQLILAIQMECCDSDLVHALFKNTKVKEAIEQGRFYQHVFPQLLSGLEFIHKLEWVHRDIHPWNILVVYNNPQEVENIVIKVGDFGLARQIGPVTTDPSVRQEVVNLSPLPSINMGKDLFKAPEIQRESYDHKVDLYSAGIVLYTLSGHSKHPDKWDKNITILRYNAARRPGKLDSHLGLNDEILLMLFRKLLHPEPDQRPSAGECRENLLESLKTRTSQNIEGMDWSSSSV